MERSIGDVTIRFVEHGDGVPLVALHGAGVDHREIEAALEAVVPHAGIRRIYPDLPGMGRSTAHGLASNDDVVTVMTAFVEGLDAGPVRLLGHSYGAYLARGIAARRPELVHGIALVCPVGESTGAVPAHEAVRQDPDAYDELDPAHRDGFDEYFVVRTKATARRYRDHVVPGTMRADEAALGRIFSSWALSIDAAPSTVPALVVAGRRDAVAGYADAIALAEDWPRSTLAVLDDAGHALPHEQPQLLAALLREWLGRSASASG